MTLSSRENPQNVNKRTKNQLSEDLQKYSDVTTLHGLRYIFGEDITLVRLLWVFVFLFMIAGFITSFGISLRNFLKYESAISISKEKNKTLIFPAITVCNLNYISRSKVEKIYPSMIELIEMMVVDPKSQHFVPALNKTLPTLKNVTFIEFSENVRYHLDEMIIQCSVMQQKLNCSEYFTELVTDKGVCYNFNTGNLQQDVLVATSAGTSYGISLTVDVQSHDYIYPTSYGTGMTLLIHDQSVYPMMDQKAFIISPGKQVFVAIQKEIIEVLSKPYSSDDCIDLSKGKMAESFTGYPYSEERCQFHCLDNYIGEMTGNCTYLGPGNNQCGIISVFSQFHKAIDNYAKEKILCHCPPTCQTTQFKYTVTNGDLAYENGEYVATYARNVTNLDEIRSRYSEIKIFYESMKYTKIIQHPSMDIAQLFSNLGGNMGLFVGASLITVFEFFDLVIRLCTRYIFKASPRSNVRNIQIKPSLTDN